MYRRFSVIVALGIFTLGAASAREDSGSGESKASNPEPPVQRQSGQLQVDDGLDPLDRPLPRITDMPVPRRGERMASVRQRFGAPDRYLSPVGDPPITRWEYPDFVVYFEHRRVVHSVVTGDSDEGDSDEGDSDEGDSDEGDSDEGDSDGGDSDESGNN